MKTSPLALAAVLGSGIFIDAAEQLSAAATPGEAPILNRSWPSRRPSYPSSLDFLELEEVMGLLDKLIVP